MNSFVFDAMPNRVSASTGVGLAHPAHAVALGQHHLPVLHDGDREPGDGERLHDLLDVGVEAGRGLLGDE